MFKKTKQNRYINFLTINNKANTNLYVKKTAARRKGRVILSIKAARFFYLYITLLRDNWDGNVSKHYVTEKLNTGKRKGKTNDPEYETLEYALPIWHCSGNRCQPLVKMPQTFVFFFFFYCIKTQGQQSIVYSLTLAAIPH